MLVYAGIDEAGYGPMFGPLVIGRMVLGVRCDHGAATAEHPRPDLWRLLNKVVCRDLTQTRRSKRIAINDSKAIYSPAVGIKHLELGVLAFAGLAERQPAHLGEWLDILGEQTHHDLSATPWYASGDDTPWQALPCCVTAGEAAVARGMLTHAAKERGVETLDLGAAVVFEDRFNRMVGATRSKAAASFTFVAAHLQHIWEHFGTQRPHVVVDRQSGRTHYRELLAMTFPDAELTIEREGNTASVYTLATSRPTARAMTVRFEVEAEKDHMPVALASMISKYTRELLMARFQNWFARRAPAVKPTAGYALDAQRFWREIQPILPELAIQPQSLQRLC